MFVPYVHQLVKKVKETGILLIIDKPKCENPKTVWTPQDIVLNSDKLNREKPKTGHTPGNIAAVAESGNNINSPSISTIEHFGDIIETNFLHKDLGMMPSNVQLVQELKPNDHPMRFRFSKWDCDR